MAIALDTFLERGSTSASTTRTVSHTCTGSNLILFVGVWSPDATGTPTATYNGVGMTMIGTWKAAAFSGSTGLFMLVGPATGAHDYVVTFSGAGDIYTWSASYTGCKQTGQPDNNGEANGNSTSASISITTVADNCWLIGSFTSLNNYTSAGANTTMRGVADVFKWGDTNAAQTPAGSYSIALNKDTGTWNLQAVSIAPVAVAGAAANHWLLMGV